MASFYRRVLSRFSRLADDARVAVRESDLRERCRTQADRIVALEEQTDSLSQQLKLARSENEVLSHEIELLAAVNVRSLDWIKNVRETEGDSTPPSAVTSDGSN